jgi:Raf kinase inhibitor-like YbhB/YbcL family protein
MRSVLTAAAVVAFFSALPAAPPLLAQPAPQKLAVTSPTVFSGQTVPKQHTPDGRNDSPALNWSNVPAGTKEFVVICEDPDAGNPPPFVHWVIYKIPGTATGLPEALPVNAATPMPPALQGAIQGLNGFRRPVYRGPAPPPGNPHPYHFVVYAIDIALDAPKPGLPAMNRAELMAAMQGHILGQGEIVATYGRARTQ